MYDFFGHLDISHEEFMSVFTFSSNELLRAPILCLTVCYVENMATTHRKPPKMYFLYVKIKIITRNM